MNNNYELYIADIKYEEKKMEELMVEENKSPAVLFYTSDFLSNTRTMTFNDIGMLITLLCLQHQNGHLSELDMLSICGAYNEYIYRFFIKDEEGKYYNKRFEDECIKRKKFIESRRVNRSKKTYVKHMENENINENINEYVNENNYSNNVKESILDWLEYKVQRNENYQEKGVEGSIWDSSIHFLNGKPIAKLQGCQQPRGLDRIYFKDALYQNTQERFMQRNDSF